MGGAIGRRSAPRSWLKPLTSREKLVQPAKQMTVADLTAHYAPYFEARKNVRNCRLYARRWCEVYGHRPARGITHLDIEAFRSRLLQLGLSKSSCNRYLGYLKRCYSLAIREGLLQSNPVTQVRQYPEEGRMRWLTEDEEAMLMEQLGQRGRDVVVLATHTGLRSDELWSLRWEDVDLVRGWLWVRPGKTGRGRRIPLTDRAAATLSSLERSPEFVFPNSMGTKMHARNLCQLYSHQNSHQNKKATWFSGGRIKKAIFGNAPRLIFSQI